MKEREKRKKERKEKKRKKERKAEGGRGRQREAEGGRGRQREAEGGRGEAEGGRGRQREAEGGRGRPSRAEREERQERKRHVQRRTGLEFEVLAAQNEEAAERTPGLSPRKRRRGREGRKGGETRTQNPTGFSSPKKGRDKIRPQDMAKNRPKTRPDIKRIF